MNDYIYLIILVGLQDLCNHQLVACSGQYQGEWSEVLNVIFCFANKFSKIIGVLVLAGLFLIKTSLPWYSPLIIGLGGFCLGALLFIILSKITHSNMLIDFVLKIASVFGVLILTVLYAKWFWQFVELITTSK